MFKSNYNKKHILLVDDDRDQAEALSLLLETRGYCIEETHSAREALNAISTAVDLVLLDRTLPDKDGFEVCRQIKERFSTHHIPIILFSDKNFCDDIVEGLYLGADDYIIRPVECEELIARIESVLRRASNQSLDYFEYQVREKIISELRRILHDELITPFFQPIFWLNPLKVYGFEVLSRPQTTSILSNPEVLFKVAIQFGCYTELEMVCWKKAMNYANQKTSSEKLFFNCNPYLVENPKYSSIKSLFDTNHINPQRVILEVTERAAISNFKVFYQYLNHFRKDGFGFAVDDVGGGYASLESIVETKPEVVKIDPHIVKDLDTDSYKRSIVKFIAAFCKENKIISVAEGIESKKDLDIIKSLGVDAGQGYFLAEPKAHIDLNQLNSISQT